VTRIKICGITDPDDARDAALLGADTIGMIFFDRSPRFIDASRAARIIEALPACVSVVGVFVNHPNPQGLEDFAVSLGLHAVQLQGNESPDYCSMIQKVKVIKAFHVDETFRVESLRNYGGTGTFLLDSGGGTGKTFDWSKAYGANAFGWIMLAGGLNPDNVADAIRQTHPFAVDVSSGVETSPGKKSYEKVRRFIENVRKTDVSLLEGGRS
jgi:phosphoribosylanthranilate isomerase